MLTLHDPLPDNMKIPEWMKPYLTELKNPVMIDYDSSFHGKFIYDEILYNTVTEAYNNVPYDRDTQYLSLTDNAMSYLGWDWDDMFFTGEGNQILLFHNYDLEASILRDDLINSINSVRKWRNNKDSFRHSYFMLDSHPAFWKIHWHSEKDFSWSTDQKIQGFWHAVGGDKGFMMECGSHTPDLQSRYHDHRLDTWGTSFEDCIIQTATLVDMYFHENGDDRDSEV